MKRKISFLLILTLTHLICISCSDEDVKEPFVKEIQPEQLKFLHNNASKKWKITAYYKNYAHQFMDDDKLYCLKDEVFTFKQSTKEVDVALGDDSCFNNRSDLLEEHVFVKYFYLEDSKKLFLEFSVGATFSPNIYQGNTRLPSCLKLTEDEMFFTIGDDLNNDIGIVFSKIN